jgi:putative membrane protein insertion efficiency factor
MGRGQSRRAWLIIFALLWAAHDLFVPARYAADARAALYAIEGYQAHVSPHLHGVVQCRFTPTCSHYGHDAIAKYGLLVGGAKTVGRLARCGPWTKLGTYDPP